MSPSLECFPLNLHCYCTFPRSRRTEQKKNSAIYAAPGSCVSTSTVTGTSGARRSKSPPTATTVSTICSMTSLGSCRPISTSPTAYGRYLHRLPVVGSTTSETYRTGRHTCVPASRVLRWSSTAGRIWSPGLWVSLPLSLTLFFPISSFHYCILYSQFLFYKNISVLLHDLY